MKLKLMESKATLRFQEIDSRNIENILNNIHTTNKRYNPNQFLKLINDVRSIWIGCFVNDTLCALSAVEPEEDGVYYLNIIQSFKKGHGKKLLEYLLSKYDNFYLLSDPDASNELNDYYRQFGLKEYRVEQPIWNKPITLFYQAIDEQELIDRINQYYKRK